MALKSNFNHILPLFWQLARFGVVGLCAAIVHFCSVVILVELHWLQPLLANIVAFCIAFQVSYWGHRCWTFNGTKQAHVVAFTRLLLVSSAAFIANEGLFYLLMQHFALPYPLALVLVLAVLPLFVFTLNKMWVFE